MARQEYYLGSVGPLIYDDSATYPDAVPMKGMRAPQIHVDNAPVASGDVATKSYADGIMTTTTLGTMIAGATSKTTPVDTDQVPISDSAASNILKKLSWANVKATLKTYFDTLYMSLGSSFTLDQTTPQTIINGFPITSLGWQFTGTTAPAAPPASSLRLYSEVVQGNTRPVYQDDDGLEITIARDNFFIAKNTSGGAINKGQVAYVTGSTGNVPNVGLAKADSLTTLPCVGVALANVSNNSFGYFMELGILPNINTSAFSVGDQLWVSSTTAGGLTKTRPAYPSYVQRVGSVLVSGVGNGSILVTVAPFIGGQETGTVNNWQSSGTVTAAGFSGPLTGNVTGNCSGSSGSCTGNAATATKLATARNINGVAFDGTADITIAVTRAADYNMQTMAFFAGGRW